MRKHSPPQEQTRNAYIPNILSPLTVLKEDTPLHSSGPRFRPQGFSGAENFRKIKKIAGLGQPTEEGIRNVCAAHPRPKVWVNLREDPVVYINGLPYVLRDRASPFRNARFFSGMSPERLEEMEHRLKQDIVGLAAQNRGFIQVLSEKHPESLWTNRTKVETVRTPREAFECQGSGASPASFRYFRLPLSRTWESAERFLAELDRIVSEHPRDFFVFSCSRGLSRTGYGMAACWAKQRGQRANKASAGEVEMQEQHSDTSFLSRTISVLERALSKKGKKRETLGEWLKRKGNVLPVVEKALRGEYAVVSRFVLAFGASRAKSVADTALSRHCSFFFNAVPEFCVQEGEDSHGPAQSRALCVLQRYLLLITYCTFITEADTNVKQEAGTEGAKRETVGEKGGERFKVWMEKSAAHAYARKVFSGPHLAGLLAPFDALALVNPPAHIKWTAVVDASIILSADVSRKEKARGPETAAEKWNVHILPQPRARRKKPQPGSPTNSPDFGPGSVLVVLRAEPVVYIGGIPHAERDTSKPFGNIRTATGITAELLEVQEQRICERIREEGKGNRGRIGIFHTLPSGKFISKKVRASSQTLSTCKSFVLSECSPASYHRLPWVSRQPLDPEIIDALWSLCLHRASIDATTSSSSSSSTPLIFVASGGEGRARIARVFSVAFEMARSGAREILDPDNGPHSKRASFYVSQIEALLRVLPDGVDAERIVRAAYRLCGVPDMYTFSGNFLETQAETLNYFGLVCFAGFLLLQKHRPRKSGRPNASCSFREWMRERGDVFNIYTELRANILGTTEKKCREAPLAPVTRAWGRILTPLTILKDDFFPALRCTAPAAGEDIKGCSNYRRVIFGDTEIYGLAQPTEWGVQNLVAKISEPSKRPVHWFCLRQEPVVYIEGKPFVLRTPDRIYENIITEGITREWVEDIEQRMKQDAVEQAGALVLHEEVFREGVPVLVEAKRAVNPEDIKTPKEVFRQNPNSPAPFVYHRTPVSDEQVPLPEAFDELLETITQVLPPQKLVFSCQMGRGRTTIGMVVAGIISEKRKLEAMGSKEAEKYLEKKQRDIVYKDEHLVITKLLQVLPNGRESKNITDTAVQKCSHVQNIYEAIRDHDEKCGSRSYLTRYFYIICFASFLLHGARPGSRRPEGEHKPKHTFKMYLEDRPEITAILHHTGLHMESSRGE